MMENNNYGGEDDDQMYADSGNNMGGFEPHTPQQNPQYDQMYGANQGYSQYSQQTPSQFNQY